MKPKLQKTFTPGPGDVTRAWHLVDADGIPLGRLASKVAQLLRGKHKPTYAPHVDGGDFVVVVNADKIAVTGSKELTKTYYRHSGYPGGLTSMTLAEMRARYPERIIETAVRGMLPKNRLGRRIIGKLKVYAGPDHPHAAQDPRPLGMGRPLDNGKKVGA
ncbi:MAG: 50S ribosomal protein L13 [Acidimicrobiia bacterium]